MSLQEPLYVEHTIPEEAGDQLPDSLLYSTSARIGGTGLDMVVAEALRASLAAGFLKRVYSYQHRDPGFPRELVSSLRWAPVRLLSFLSSPYYYAAKKRFLDQKVAAELRSGEYDFFHSWSGDCLKSLRVARELGIPSMLEIPTWHRHKGKRVGAVTRRERELEEAPWPKRLKEGLLINRSETLEEYELATTLMVQSKKAAETFRQEGFPAEKLFYLPRAVDASLFRPGPKPEIFRAVFAGALITRKGVHFLLEAWNRLNLKNAELILLGNVHREIRPYLAKYKLPNVKVIGFTDDLPGFFRSASVHIFPSTCEGSAKVTYEAAAAGLPQITTREAGDVVVDGLNGRVIPCDDVDALAGAIQEFHDSPDLLEEMGRAGRERVMKHFTWEQYRQRLLAAYRYTLSRV